MNSDNKTLIILTPGFPANEADSTCLPFPQLFVKKIKQLNPSLNIIVFAFQYPFVVSEYEWHQVKVISFNGRNKGKINRLLLWKSIWKRLNTIIKENNVTGILNFWLGECGLIGKWAAKKYKLKSFTWLLGQDARKNNRYFSLVRPDAKSLIALSDFIAEEFYRNYGITPANIIPPGIDTTQFCTLAVERDIDMMGSGSLIPLKRYAVFIKVVEQLVKSHPNIKTIICGKGVQEEYLRQIINDTGLSGNIELCGEVNHAEVLNLMQRSKVFLHPSSYEGFATVINEALYAGTQVVAFCQPMNTGFKNQHVVKSEDEMAEKVNELLTRNNLNHDGVITLAIEQTCHKISALYGM
jgi:glycosyltransferase involved in cell wall biosynthesis